MEGFQLTFFTSQDQSHKGHPLGDWLLQEARRLGIGGATLLAAVEGFGHHRKIHSAHFIELADQPLEVTMAVTTEQAEQVFTRLSEEHISIFYIQTPITFGMSSERQASRF